MNLKHTISIDEKGAELTYICPNSSLKIFFTFKKSDKTQILIDSSDADIITINELHKQFQNFLIQNKLI